MKKSHAPAGYVCPICLGIRGVESVDTLLRQDDLVFRDDLVSVWINSFWVGRNEGHLIIVPNAHFENIYDLPNEVGHRIFDIAKIMSEALREAYKCDGVTIRQNNEPAGDQHAFHYHLHLFPRYIGDDFNQKLAEKSRLSDPAERKMYADKLRKFLHLE